MIGSCGRAVSDGGWELGKGLASDGAVGGG